MVPPERLVVAPDCGMKYLPRERAFRKLAGHGCRGAPGRGGWRLSADATEGGLGSDDEAQHAPAEREQHVRARLRARGRAPVRGRERVGPDEVGRVPVQVPDRPDAFDRDAGAADGRALRELRRDDVPREPRGARRALSDRHQAPGDGGRGQLVHDQHALPAPSRGRRIRAWALRATRARCPRPMHPTRTRKPRARRPRRTSRATSRPTRSSSSARPGSSVATARPLPTSVSFARSSSWPSRTRSFRTGRRTTCNGWRRRSARRTRSPRATSAATSRR